MDAQQQITNKIIEMLEAANANGFEQPWISVGTGVASPVNVISRKSYSALNALFLWLSAEAKGYTSGEWGTFKQWKEKGASVRKGEKGTMVHGWFKASSKAADNDTAEADEGDDEGRNTRLACRVYYVFNASQVDGYEQQPIALPSLADRLEAAEAYFENLNIATHHGGNRAFYSPAADAITMPAREQFVGTRTRAIAEFG